jgi:histidinol-phosphate phosphatase family protein
MQNLSETTALVLVGGIGSRLRAVVSDRPKVLASIHNRPFLAYLLDALDEAGICRAVLCTGYMAELVEDTFGPTYRRMRLAYSQESSPLGTAGALRAALPLVETDYILAMNGDSFCEFDLPGMASAHSARAAEATILLTEVPDTQRFGRVRFDGEGWLLAFEEKGAHQGPGWINAGVYLIKRRMLETIPEHSAVSMEKEVFPAWIGRGLFGHPAGGRFLDIGTPQSFAEAEAFFGIRHAATHESNPKRGIETRTVSEEMSKNLADASGFDASPRRTLTRRFVALDRDGTIIVERRYLSSPDELELLPGAAAGLRAMRDMGLELVIVTNQSAVGRGYFDLARLEQIHARLRQILTVDGVEIAGIFVCPHTPEDSCRCRKPLGGLLLEASRKLGFDPADALVIGDKPCDIDLGLGLGATTILVRTGYGAEHEAAGLVAPDYIVDDLVAAAEVARRWRGND